MSASPSYGATVRAAGGSWDNDVITLTPDALIRLSAALQRPANDRAWLAASRFNCLAIDRPALPERAAFASNADYLKACEQIADETMGRALAQYESARKARRA
ncbi:hypothetical protein [uncultured Ramlibacter sp.]|uniref:hypothetical protein n=1 Tax=uncultured Ramlibacter sp. TaxID=260755 RepID=UPI0026344750|nr:hypothetical protein [uncultured Ramlibacter sp.]